MISLGELDLPSGLAAKRVRLDQLIAADPAPIEFVIPDIVVTGLIHHVYGEPESGKTIVTLRWTADVIARRGTVVFIDEESGRDKISGLLRAMGVANVDEYLHYIPFPGIDAESLRETADEILALQPELVICDTLTDMLVAAQFGENAGEDVTKWMKAFPEYMARRGPAVVLTDHVTKDGLNSRYAVGSRAKKAKTDIAWHVTRDGDFDRSHTATLTLTRQKNRPGILPPKVSYLVGGVDGRLVCERLGTARIAMTLTPLQTEIISILDESDIGLSSTEIIEKTTLRTSREPNHGSIHNALSELVKREFVTRTGVRGNFRYTRVIAVIEQSSGLGNESPTSHSSSPFSRGDESVTPVNATCLVCGTKLHMAASGDYCGSPECKSVQRTRLA